MKTTDFTGYIEVKNKMMRLGILPAFGLKEAKILFQAEAIKKGLDYKLVVVARVDYEL